MTLSPSGWRSFLLSHIGMVEFREEEPILKRRHRMSTITVQCDIDDALQPPEVTTELEKILQPVRHKLPAGYSINVGANTEESAKANDALAAVFPAMIICMLVVIIFKSVHSQPWR